MRKVTHAGGVILLCLSACVLFAGCGLVRPPDGQSVPPEGSREALVTEVINALDRGDRDAVASYFPKGSPSRIQQFFENCGAILTSTREIPDVGDIVPYRLTVYMSGNSVQGDETVACYFTVQWTGYDGPWSLSSKSIPPSGVPTLSPSGEWVLPSPSPAPQ